MKKILSLLIIIFSVLANAQEDAWVYFTDKPDMQYYLDNPLEMLSQRALDRRTLQNIALDAKDVPVHEAYINQITGIPGITVMAKSKWLNAVHVRGSLQNINLLTDFVFVQNIEFANKFLNTALRGISENNVVNKTLETTLNYNYGTSANQIQMLNGHLLHQQGYTGAGKIIAVMDAGYPGVNTAQPFQRLHDNNLVLGGYNFVARNSNIYTSNSHGTLVLSTMGGYKENQLIGTAPDAQYYLFITEDTSAENPVEESYWVEAAELADSLGVDIINTSLGYFDFDNAAYNYTYQDINGQTSFITRGANIAFSRGMICVTSAGNSGNSSSPHIGVPADAFNTLAVGSVTANGLYSSFSSTGNTQDGRVKPDVMAQGTAAVVSDASGNIGTLNGTSFSSPVTAGLVACLWQALPDKTNLEIINLIKQSADRFNNPTIQYGYGIPDFNLALSQALSINDVKNPASVILYPNPAEKEIHFLLPENTLSASIKLFNSLGQLMIEQTIYSDQPSILIENLSCGIYHYIIQLSETKISGKLVKN